MVTVLAQVLGRLVKTVAYLVFALLRRPGLTVPLLVAVVVAVQVARWGWVTRASVLVLVLAVVVVWRRQHRSSFNRLVWIPAVQWYRRWIRYGLAWRFWMGRCGLGIKDETTGRTMRPRVVKMRYTPSVDRLLVQLPVGLTSADLDGKRLHLAESMRAIDARIRKDRPGRVWLDLEMRNPLQATIPAIPVDESLDPAILDGLVIGYADDGTPWRLRVRGSHVFIAGATGSGKGSIIWSTLRALGPFIRAGLVEIWAVDPKGGMELEFGKDLFTRYERDDYESMVTLLEDAAQQMDERCKRLRGTTRTFNPTTATPLVMVVVDELATLTALQPDRRLQGRAENALGLLLTKGRAPGFHVLAAVQDVTKRVCEWRDLFPDKIALRLGKATEVDMVLGDDAWDNGALCDSIPRSLPGIGYVRMEGQAHSVRVRAAYVTDNEIRTMARDYRPRRVLHAIDAPSNHTDTPETGEAA
ncbi:S-DNA-T family DNA segregation ATPase FtsK/SpoIIIE [Kribbella sp. VKM Ac-2527]|uniref:S-DNA-T family DNA segregation ATPase FtsK/SpoIIIE n=1 Tax=Kribbella caucasensis TaxID=2512215 RepID=A0A4R6KC23_9ACTN|nr:cell division protein FtsK [Kribbella sp. VKM Ac-2527]TDO45876.1 S-DNA-T family DNA segregation ATPase FtsK/SpoIIIE [Kribbella sp. VKM Ac-2527]